MYKYKKVIYIASILDIEMFKQIYVLNEKPSYAASKYHNQFIKGLLEQGIEVFVNSIIPINKKIYSKYKIDYNCRKSSRINILNKYNFPIIKHVLIFLKIIKLILKEKKDTIVVFDSLILTASVAIFFATMINKMTKVAIITDLPEFMPISKFRLMRYFNEAWIKQSDVQIILNQQMIGKIGIREDKAVIIDGFMSDFDTEVFPKTKSNVIMYAGTIDEKYGIKELCESFIKSNHQNYELHFYGNGDFSENLREYSIKTPSIKYHGSISNDIMLMKQKTVKFLINPRHPNQDFTKYSFPSKILEYMSSGTAVVMFLLPGMSTDYEKLSYIIPADLYPDYSSYLNYLYSLHENDVLEKGINALEYVKLNKNPSSQALKLLTKLNEIKE